MKNTIRDIKTAVGLFADMRKARRAGGEVEVRRVTRVSVIPSGGFYDTVEGCALSHCGRDIIDAAQDAFAGLPDSERRSLAFSPKDGEFVERAIFWSGLLEPAMTEAQSRAAMIRIIRWYIHIKRTRLQQEAAGLD